MPNSRVHCKADNENWAVCADDGPHNLEQRLRFEEAAVAHWAKIVKPTQDEQCTHKQGSGISASSDAEEFNPVDILMKRRNAMTPGMLHREVAALMCAQLICNGGCALYALAEGSILNKPSEAIPPEQPTYPPLRSVE